MTTLGPNLKLTIAARWRPQVHDLFVDILGATTVQPSANFEVYLLDGGKARVGVAYAPDGEALSPDDQRKGAWLEFRVADPANTAARLEAKGVPQIDYTDRDHAYFAIPGGPVFRLAAG